jgi:hypothetical protein
MCDPIKRALKNEPLIVPNLGHVICPYAYVNLSRVINGEFTQEEIRKNYKECIE